MLVTTMVPSAATPGHSSFLNTTFAWAVVSSSSSVTSTTTTISSSLSTSPAMGIGYSQNVVTSRPTNLPLSSSVQSVTAYQNLHNQLHSIAYPVATTSFLTPTVPVASSVSPSSNLPPNYHVFLAQQPNLYSLLP